MTARSKWFFNTAFYYICLICTIVFTGQCIWQFSLDKDLAEIEFREFHQTPNDLYPSMTFCHTNPFIKDKLYNQGTNLTTDEYRKYLAGVQPRGWEMLTDFDKQLVREIDYDEVSIDIKDYVTTGMLTLSAHDMQYSEVSGRMVQREDTVVYSMQNDSLAPDINVNIEKYKAFPEIKYYVSVRHPDYKCFTFETPFAKGQFLKNLRLDISASLFKDEIVTSSSPDLNYFVTYGYPNQLIRSSAQNMVDTKLDGLSTSCLLLDKVFRSVEVLHRRDKPGNRCLPDWKNHDKYVMKDIAIEVGCKPCHWKLELDIQNCSTKAQHRRCNAKLSRPNHSMVPCRSIELLLTTTNEVDLGIKCTLTYPHSGSLFLSMDFSKETMYKEVVRIRAYTLQSLVGNSGNIYTYI